MQIQIHINQRYRLNEYLYPGKWFVICGVPISKRIELSVRKVVRVRCFDKDKSFQNLLFSPISVLKERYICQERLWTSCVVRLPRSKPQNRNRAQGKINRGYKNYGH